MCNTLGSSMSHFKCVLFTHLLAQLRRKATRSTSKSRLSHIIPGNTTNRKLPGNNLDEAGFRESEFQHINTWKSLNPLHPLYAYRQKYTGDTFKTSPTAKLQQVTNPFLPKQIMQKDSLQSTTLKLKTSASSSAH